MYLEKLAETEDRASALGILLTNYHSTYGDGYLSELIPVLFKTYYLPTVLTSHVLSNLKEALCKDDGSIHFNHSMSLNRFYAFMVTSLGGDVDELLTAAEEVYVKTSLTKTNNLILPDVDPGVDGDEVREILISPAQTAAEAFRSMTTANEMKVILIYLALWNGIIPTA